MRITGTNMYAEKRLSSQLRIYKYRIKGKIAKKKKREYSER